MAWLRLIRDRFIAGHNSFELRRHLDSVPPETPIRDIVDRCRVWESHADSDVRRVNKPGPEPESVLPEEGSDVQLDDIITGSHPSLGEVGQLSLRSLRHRYAHVLPAAGESVTGRTTLVQHEILTSDARPVRCGPRRLAPANLRTEQMCIKEMLVGGQIEPRYIP